MVTTVAKPAQTKARRKPRPPVFENANRWPRTILEAYARGRGPYNVENASTLLEEEPLEIYNGWLVWDKMTDFKERRAAANIHEILSFRARFVGFGQAYPDQVECELSEGDVIKPDVCMVSEGRVIKKVIPRGPDNRLILQGGPEVAVELRSPSNTRAEERRKREKYFDNGTLIVWDVDPIKDKVWVYRAENRGQSKLFQGNDLIDCEPFLPGWRHNIADFFADTLSAEKIAGEAATEWRAEGHAQGQLEGQLQAVRELILRQAQRRFAGESLPTDFETRLTSFNLEQLNELADTIATTPGLKEWLTTFPG